MLLSQKAGVHRARKQAQEAVQGKFKARKIEESRGRGTLASSPIDQKGGNSSQTLVPRRRTAVRLRVMPGHPEKVQGTNHGVQERTAQEVHSQV